MRALLVANPTATTTNAAVRDGVRSRLEQHFDEVEVGLTKQRGHALHLVAGAVHDGVDAVFALGGDGTANEVLQGVATTDVAFCHVPGGGTNVLARALGAPNDPFAATDRALAALRGEPRRIALGKADDRWFGAIAGFGFDAAVVRRVEQRPRLKRRARQLAFVVAAFAEWFADDPGIVAEVTVQADGSPAGPYAITMVGNGDPYTWLGPRPLQVTPHASLEAGLDVLAVRATSLPQLLAIVAKAFSGGRHLRHARVDHWHDLDGFVLSCARPQPLMVDGDYAGDHRQVRFASVPRALRVLA